jgi:hypothetical protein
MGWFDVLKLQRDIFGNPISEEKEEKIKSPSESFTDFGSEEEVLDAPDVARQKGIAPIRGKYKQEHIKKPKKSHQQKLTSYVPTHFREAPTSERDTSGQSGDDVKLTTQEATRMAQKEPRGHYKDLASEMARIALYSQNSDGQKQKKLLGRMRRRLEQENIPRA